MLFLPSFPEEDLCMGLEAFIFEFDLNCWDWLTLGPPKLETKLLGFVLTFEILLALPNDSTLYMDAGLVLPLLFLFSGNGSTISLFVASINPGFLCSISFSSCCITI